MHLRTELLKQHVAQMLEMGCLSRESYEQIYLEIGAQESQAEWTTEPPAEPGNHWFYGDDQHGSMGIDFWPNKPPTEPKMHYVSVRKISNGLMALCEGHFMPLNRFDITKRQEGCLGYWKPAFIPEPPADTENLFASGPEYKAP